MGRLPDTIEALGEGLARFLRQPEVLALSPAGTWGGPGAWTLAEAFRLWSRNRLSPVAIGSADPPVLHVAVKLPGRRVYLDAAGLSSHQGILDRYRRSRPRDNPFFIPYDPNFFRFSGLPFWPASAETLAGLLTEAFGDVDPLL